MNKNPYEVRLDIMKMAQEMLNREIDLKQNEYFSRVENLRSTNASITDLNAIEAPKMYTPEEVISRASALYSFVNNTTSVPNKKETK